MQKKHVTGTKPFRSRKPAQVTRNEDNKKYPAAVLRDRFPEKGWCARERTARQERRRVCERGKEKQRAYPWLGRPFTSFLTEGGGCEGGISNNETRIEDVENTVTTSCLNCLVGSVMRSRKFSSRAKSIMGKAGHFGSKSSCRSCLSME